jgi:hypothetical protein
MTALLDKALKYSDFGWSIISITNEPKEKAAAVEWTPYQTSRPSAAKLRKWFARRDVTGLAVIFGAVSGGLASRDWDVEGAYERWAQDHAKLAISLPTARTARGHHVYFRAELERFENLEDGEYRGDCGHYSVLPPSLHPSGVRYAWTIPLPKGELPLIDPVEVGLVPAEKTDRETEETEITEKLRDRETEAIASVSPSLCLSVSDAIRLTIPNSEGQRNRKLFDFARALKGLDEFKTAALVKVKPTVRQWHTAALPFIGTKDFDATWMEFGYAWDRVRTAMGSDPLAEALIRARAAVLPPEASDYDSENSRLLVKVCIELQRVSADQPFFLSCRSAGALLDIDHDSANKLLLMLVRDGLLKLVRRGNEHRANRFLYIGGEK